MSDILAERKPVTPELAVKLAKLFGSSPKVWTNLQTNHDIWHAQREVDSSPILKLVAAE